MKKREQTDKINDLLQLGQLRAEKCELKEAEQAYHQALELSRRQQDLSLVMEALAGLLRLAIEALDEKAIERWNYELDSMMKSHPDEIPPMAWYCNGALARYRCTNLLAQRHFHRFLRMVRAKGNSEDLVARGWLMLAIILQQRGRILRAKSLAYKILQNYEEKNIRGLNGINYLLLGTLEERQKNYSEALQWFQKAHSQFLGDHNWYYHLYVLYGYARLSRYRKDYSQANWYLELVEKAVAAPEFGLLRREINAERIKLQQESVDLTIDCRKGTIHSKESGSVSLRKQYILLNILEALSKAHSRSGRDFERGLSKAELIEHVWKESYRPDIHDNKLYYNINRLRKLIEPDVRKPQYLLNWKEGYRLAPGLKIQIVGDQLKN